MNVAHFSLCILCYFSSFYGSFWYSSPPPGSLSQIFTDRAPPFRNCKFIRGDAKEIVSSDVGTSEISILGHPPPPLEKL